MTTDKQLQDFMLGQIGVNTGSIMNETGLRSQLQPPASSSIPITSHATAGVALPPAKETYTEEQLKEFARWDRNRSMIRQTPGFIARLSGKVISYLNEKASLICDEHGDLVTGEEVPKKEHLERLKAAYWSYFDRVAKYSEEQLGDDEKYRVALDDAKLRLDYLEKGKFISPLSELNGLKFESCFQYVEKRRFLGPKKTKGKYKVVGLEAYDKHLRHFVDQVYARRFYSTYRQRYYDPTMNGKNVAANPARQVICYFLAHPKNSSVYWTSLI